MEWFWIFLIVVVVIVITVFSSFSNESTAHFRNEKIEARISELPNQESLKKIVGGMGRYAFVLDNVGRKIYYIESILTEEPAFSTQTKDFAFDQIISVEILEDNTILSSKSTSRTVGGALIGGALAGGAGMVVGGLSGDSMQKKKVSKLSVKIKIRDYSTPTLMIECFDAHELTGYNEIKTTDNLYGHFYKDELQNAQKIADYVNIIIDEVDRQEKQSLVARPTSAEGLSVADEIKKLASLKEQGILSEEEFQVQKEKLLK